MLSYSAAFVAAYALFLVVLAANVARLRVSEKVSLGEGTSRVLRHAVRAHGNAVEHMLPFMVLLVVHELQGGGREAILGLGVGFAVARVAHAVGLLAYVHMARRLGAGLSMTLTFALGVLVFLKALG